MTTRHVQNAFAAVLAGWRIQRAPDTDIHLTHAGRVALPLALFHGEAPFGSLPLVVTAEEAEALYVELGRLLHPQANGESP